MSVCNRASTLADGVGSGHGDVGAAGIEIFILGGGTNDHEEKKASDGDEKKGIGVHFSRNRRF